MRIVLTGFAPSLPSMVRLIRRCQAPSPAPATKTFASSADFQSLVIQGQSPTTAGVPTVALNILSISPRDLHVNLDTARGVGRLLPSSMRRICFMCSRAPARL